VDNRSNPTSRHGTRYHHARCFTQQLPKRLAIGDGYIGVEFSSMMNALGVQVTLMETDKLIFWGLMMTPDVWA